MLDSLFNPKTVAIIGASSKELHIGNRIVRNLIDFGYKGNIYPINPNAKKICDIKAYKSILDVPNEIDVVHIVIPANFVYSAVESCGKKGVKNIIINSSGFSEMGNTGNDIQSKILLKAAKHKMRIFGPNCQGIINSDINVKAYCNFTFSFPKPGNISIAALSGGVAELIHQKLITSGVGTRIYASNGNACDISISEIIEYLGNDKNTNVIITYLEGLKNPEVFFKTVKKIASKKPILAMKSGRTLAGINAIASHTGGLAKEDTITDLIFKKTGILSFTNERKMINAAIVLASQPIPKGNNVGIITNTGGPAVIVTDTLIENGFTIPKLSNSTIKKLNKNLYKEASINNPIDILATGTSEHYKICLNALLEDKNIDSIFINFVTPFFVDSKKIAKEIIKINNKSDKPIICNLITDRKKWPDTYKILKNSSVPCFSLPSDAAHAFSSLEKYRRIINTNQGIVKSHNIPKTKRISKIFTSINNNNYNNLLAEEVYSILDAYKIKTPTWKVEKNLNDVLKTAKKIGYPVVIKANSKSLIHKSDTGGVCLNLSNELELKNAMSSIKSKIKKKDLSFLLQKYIPGKVELIMGAKAQPKLGHIIMFGLGGIFVDVFKDVVFELTPISNIDAMEMINSIKSSKIIHGIRGQKGFNINKLVELLELLSQLVIDFPQIKELDFNPIIASKEDVIVLDARISL